RQGSSGSSSHSGEQGRKPRASSNYRSTSRKPCVFRAHFRASALSFVKSMGKPCTTWREEIRNGRDRRRGGSRAGSSSSKEGRDGKALSQSDLRLVRGRRSRPRLLLLLYRPADIEPPCRPHQTRPGHLRYADEPAARLCFCCLLL